MLQIFQLSIFANTVFFNKWNTNECDSFKDVLLGMNHKKNEKWAVPKFLIK